MRANIIQVMNGKIPGMKMFIYKIETFSYQLSGYFV